MVSKLFALLIGTCMLIAWAPCRAQGVDWYSYITIWNVRLAGGP